MIQAFVPYHAGGLKQAYKQCFDMLPNDEDWAVLCDRDILWFQPNFIEWIKDYIEAHPETGMFTAYASRCSYEWQIRRGTKDTPDMRYHMQQASEVQKLHPKVKPIDGNVSGHVMVIKKAVWNQMWPHLEVTPTIKNHDVLGVDTLMSKWMHANGYPIYLMRGIYVYHLFRLWSDNPNKAIEHTVQRNGHMLNIITPCTRPKNLKKIKASLPTWAKWWVIYDRTKPENIGDVEIQHDTENTWGKAQINRALQEIPQGEYCYVLDDDNILHEDFAANIKGYLRSNQANWIGFDSTERKYNCQINQIDQAQFIWKHDGSTYQEVYNADGIFAVGYTKHKPEIIPTALAYYNKLKK